MSDSAYNSLLYTVCMYTPAMHCGSWSCYNVSTEAQIRMTYEVEWGRKSTEINMSMMTKSELVGKAVSMSDALFKSDTLINLIHLH